MKCERCKQGEATEPIFDEEAGKEIWICTDCDDELFNADTLRWKMNREIDIQLAHHRKEGNSAAVRSLEHIQGIMFKN